MKTKLTVLFSILLIGNLFAQTDSLALQQSIDTLSQKVSILERSIVVIQSSNTDYLSKNEELATKVTTLQQDISKLQSSNAAYLTENAYLKKSQNYLSSQYKKLSNELDDKSATIDSLQQVIKTNSANIEKTANELGVKIDDNQKATNESISDLGNSLSKNTLYWIIAVLVVVILLIVVFVLLRKQIFKQKTDLDTNLQDTRKALEEEGVKLDNKLVEILESQLKIIESSKTENPSNAEPDHSLALKVADEINRMQSNMSLMDKNIKGLNKLQSAVKRIEENFASNGYEIIDMIGKPYNEGMKVVIVNSRIDENLNSGEQIISRIIKPQVNYKEEMIQPAQIEVSIGE